MFMQNPWQCLVWWVDGGFNGDTVCRRRPYNRVILGVWFTTLLYIICEHLHDLYTLSSLSGWMGLTKLIPRDCLNSTLIYILFSLVKYFTLENIVVQGNPKYIIMVGKGIVWYFFKHSRLFGFRGSLKEFDSACFLNIFLGTIWVVFTVHICSARTQIQS